MTLCTGHRHADSAWLIPRRCHVSPVGFCRARRTPIPRSRREAHGAEVGETGSSAGGPTPGASAAGSPAPRGRQPSDPVGGAGPTSRAGPRSASSNEDEQPRAGGSRVRGQHRYLDVLVVGLGPKSQQAEEAPKGKEAQGGPHQLHPRTGHLCCSEPGSRSCTPQAQPNRDSGALGQPQEPEVRSRPCRGAGSPPLVRVTRS